MHSKISLEGLDEREKMDKKEMERDKLEQHDRKTPGGGEYVREHLQMTGEGLGNSRPLYANLSLALFRCENLLLHQGRFLLEIQNLAMDFLFTGFKNRQGPTLAKRFAGLFSNHGSKVSKYDERGDVPGWVLVVLMTAGLVTGIWTVAAPRLNQILRTSLDSMNSIR